MIFTRVAKAMQDKGITGVELARTLRVSEILVSRWKNGRMYVPPKHQSKLSEILEVPAEELFDERGMPK
jgi:transcriptional regulator with XRE-family HTH domain